MNMQIGDAAVLGVRTHNGSVSKDLLEVIVRTTACSPMVFAGLLAWASLDAPHNLSKGRSRRRSPLPRG